MTLPPITRPSPGEVRRYLARWNESNGGSLDIALRTLFQAMPNNTEFGEVAVKLAAVNGTYGTNIFAVSRVAEHIVGLDIDARLAKATVDVRLIEDIARVEIKGKLRRNYSFATKYCSFHRPDLYPIYDSLVPGVLNTLLNQGEAFDTFLPDEHWQTDYAVWHRSVMKFRTYFDLAEFSIRDIDKYLWMLAKERNAMRSTSATRNPPAPS